MSKFSKVRLSEVFVTVQGEGPKTGVPTTFVRTAGCSMRCEGWGVTTTLPNGKVVTGCDSPHSVFPEIYLQPGGSTFLQPEEIVDRLPEWVENICLTGGEPLLQARQLTPFVELATSRGFEVEVFTNGSVVVPEGVWRENDSITYVMDYKPSWSGEGGKFRKENFSLLTERDCIKFVCKNRDDYEEACRVMGENPGFRGKWLVGVVFGVLSPVTLISWLVKDQLPNTNLNLQTQGLMEEEGTGETFDEAERTLLKIL